MPIEVVRDNDLLARKCPPRQLSDGQLNRMLAVAVLPGTWHEAPKPSAPGEYIAREFDALHAELGPQIKAMIAAKQAERTAARTRGGSCRSSPARQPDSSGGRTVRVGCAPGRAIATRAPHASPTRRKRLSRGNSSNPFVGLVGIWVLIWVAITRVWPAVSQFWPTP